ncbi:DUF6933 domain-containing protein [Paenibacillus sp. USDA918EY]|uniref:DUF6933 domain-containing protein n=1 Tax=Paenibacillus sp. USDA918EY TaxID=2689575 RepID=UPI001F21CD29|nr:hypothetical protein [Paenibacillus sp. USDA918EY]
MALRFTQSLLKDMKVTPETVEEVDDFWSWHANIYYLNNRKHILFVNDLSRICIIIDGIRKGQLTLLQEKFLETLEAYLKYEDISTTLIEKYLNSGTDLCISKTNSRSVLGTMNEITIFNSDNFDNNLDRLEWLNRLIHKPIKHDYPIEFFKKRLEQLN